MINSRAKRIGVTIGVVTATVLGGAGAAQALPGGPWASSSSPLTASTGGQTVAAAYGTWQGYREDQNRGSRIQDYSLHRQPQSSGDRGAFVNHHWYTDGYNCYVSSFSDAGASVNCQNGWHDTGSETRTGNTTSTSWQGWETWKAVDATASSMRAQEFTCQDVAYASDPCSAKLLRGANY